MKALPGVTGLDITVRANVRAVTAPENGGPPLPGVKNIIAVGAGKGGVGKTTVSVNLALALAQMGCRVGILDGDVYGPNVPLMFGLTAELATDGQKIAPAEKYGVQVVSMAFLARDDQALIWRGPMLHSAIQQFFRDVAWKDLDYLIMDMPPGTGDVALSLSQTVQGRRRRRRDHPAGGLARRHPAGRARCTRSSTSRTLGLVENMSYYACPNCHIESDIFGHGGGEQLATEMSVPFLGRLPVYHADSRWRRPRHAAGRVRARIASRSRFHPARRARRHARRGGGGGERGQVQGEDSPDSGALTRADARSLPLERGSGLGARVSGTGVGADRADSGFRSRAIAASFSDGRQFVRGSIPGTRDPGPDCR